MRKREGQASNWVPTGCVWLASCLVMALCAGCDGGTSDIVSCTETDEEGEADEAYCFTGYDGLMGDGNDTCASRGSCVGPDYGSSTGTDLAARSSALTPGVVTVLPSLARVRCRLKRAFTGTERSSLAALVPG